LKFGLRGIAASLFGCFVAHSLTAIAVGVLAWSACGLIGARQLALHFARARVAEIAGVALCELDVY